MSTLGTRSQALVVNRASLRPSVFRDLRLGVSGTIGLVIILVLVLLAVLAPWVAPHDPNLGNLSMRNQAPFTVPEHPLGTDPLGRDVLSRLLYGGQISMLVGVGAVVIPAVVGLVLGLIAGLRGGWTDSVIMRVVDAILAFPFYTMAIFAAVVLGPSMWNVILILSVASWVVYARMVRGMALSLREKEFVLAAGLSGASTVRIVWRHLAPNVFAPLLVLGTLQVSRMVIAESTLSFLGLGVGLDTPTWGGMVADGEAYLTSAWWVSAIPGGMIAVLVLAVNMFGEGLRDRLDPKF